jgi:hypothetical protein
MRGFLQECESLAKNVLPLQPVAGATAESEHFVFI